MHIKKRKTNDKNNNKNNNDSDNVNSNNNTNNNNDNDDDGGDNTNNNNNNNNNNLNCKKVMTFSRGSRSTWLSLRQIEEKQRENRLCMDLRQFQQTFLLETSRIIRKVINTQRE